MSIAPSRPCPRCGARITGRCGRCTKRGDHARGSATARGYDTTWHRYARDWLHRFPLCGQRIDGRRHAEHSRCVQAGTTPPPRAAVVDHILAIAAGGARLDPRNHQSLCRRCNALKAVTSDVDAIRDARRRDGSRSR